MKDSPDPRNVMTGIEIPVENPIPDAYFPDHFPPEMLLALRSFIAAVRQPSFEYSAAKPFLVVTPTGMERRSEIAEWLARHGYGIVNVTAIPDWTKISGALYARTLDDQRLIAALCFEKLWRMISNELGAERWELESEHALIRLAADKHTLRAQCGCRRFRVRTSEVTFHARLQVVHVPDADRCAFEWCVLETYLADQTNRTGTPLT